MIDNMNFQLKHDMNMEIGLILPNIFSTEESNETSPQGKKRFPGLLSSCNFVSLLELFNAIKQF